jgi:sister-chromatid-cohesion protein PDS5
LDIYCSLDEAGVNLFNAMLKHRSRVNIDFNAWLTCDKQDKTQVFTRTVTLSRHVPDAHKSQEHMKKLREMFTVNKKMYDLLCKAGSVKEECSKIIAAVAEIMKMINSSKAPILETISALLDRSCTMMLDAGSFIHLLKTVKEYIDGDGDEDDDVEDEEVDVALKGKQGLKLMEVLSVVQPSVFHSKPCYELLMLFMTHSNEEVVECTLKILQNVISGINDVDKALSGSFQPVRIKLITQGSCSQAKYCMRCIKTLNKDSTSAMERLYKSLHDKMNLDTPPRQLCSTLAALAELAILAPNVFQSNYTKVIKGFVVDQVLTVDRCETPVEETDSQEEWGDDEQVSDETLIKVQAIKLLTAWLLGMKSGHSEKAEPVFRLLTKLLYKDGDLNGKGNTSAVDRSRLRLRAGVAMLKLVQNINLVDVINLEQYQQLALVMQDSCFEVREKFTTKLHKALDHLKLPLDYLAYLALVAVDPSKERKLKVRQMIFKNVHTRREYRKTDKQAASRPYAILPGYSIPYAVYLLAHHPDFDPKDNASLDQTKDYLWYFLEPIMGSKAENYSFLKKLLETIKQTRDQQDADNDAVNERLYTVWRSSVSFPLPSPVDITTSRQ